MDSELKELLRPTEANRIMDLVEAAGLDISDWANYEGKNPATNPNYCYEWCFIEDGKPIVLNIHYAEIDFTSYDVPSVNLNMREFSSGLSAMKGKKPLSNRAYRFDEALKFALRNESPIRLVIFDGIQGDELVYGKKAMKVALRQLDSEVWSIAEYDMWTGQARLHRKQHQKFVDQYSLMDLDLSESKKTLREITPYNRERKVRDQALVRADGKCELCGEEGFETNGGYKYLETHHVIPLCEKGEDNISNVVALCPRDHRMAHFSSKAHEIRNDLLSYLAKLHGRS